MATLTFTLGTPPPSVNKSRIPIINKRGRPEIIKSPEYRKWLKAAKEELGWQQKPLQKMPKKAYWRSDILIPRSMTKCDLDNHVKAIHDALGQAGLTPDDRYLVDTRVRFSTGKLIVIAIKQERLNSWIKIMKPSKSLISQLAK